MGARLADYKISNCPALAGSKERNQVAVFAADRALICAASFLRAAGLIG
jgi:hypothetical protein